MSSAAVQSIQQTAQQYPHSSPAPSTFTPDQSPDLSLSPPSSRRPTTKFAPGNGAPPNTPQSSQRRFTPIAQGMSNSPPVAHYAPNGSDYTPKSYSSLLSQDAPSVKSPSRSPSDPAQMQDSPISPQTTQTAPARSSHPYNTPDVPTQVDVDRSRQDAGSTPGAVAAAKKREQRIVSAPLAAREGLANKNPIKSRSAAALTHGAANTSHPSVNVAPPVAEMPSDLATADAQENSQQGKTQQRSRQEHLRNAQPKRETKFGDYILGQTIGEGEFGKVKMGWKRQGGVQVAIKLIRREALGNDAKRLPKIYREIKILQGLDHDNIVRLREMVETDKHIGIILEYASGGELFDHILTYRYLKDAPARRLFAQLVSGVGYLHQKGIVHRDLKLENLLLDRNNNIIITDFGFANTFDPRDELGQETEYNLGDKKYVKNQNLETPDPATGHRRGDLMATSCGSPCYAAPELVVSDTLYTGRKVDVWSCGVILYAMLAGYLPFDDDPANPEGDNINLLYKYIVTTPLTFPEYVTPHARDILRRILVPDPRKRADLFEVARHSWLNDYAHSLAFITSDVATKVDSASHIPPLNNKVEVANTLARSASVRETTKSSITAGGLVHPGPTIVEEDKSRTMGDAKRRTVQLEYVAPPTQTARGDPQLSARSPALHDTVSKNAAANARSSPAAPSPRTLQRSAGNDGTSPADSPRHPRHPPRSVSDSSAFVSASAKPEQRTTSRGNANATSRLPSRGNSYARPVAATVAATNVEGRLSQPTYDPSPASQEYTDKSQAGDRLTSEQTISNGDQARPSTGHEQMRSKRNSAVESITSRIFGRSNSTRRYSGHAQDVAPTTRPERKNRMFPPVSLQNARSETDAEPTASRKSTDSRRSSFGFTRRNSEDNKEKRSSKRFSFIPATFSRMSLGPSAADDDDVTENKRASMQQPPRSRHDSKGFFGMAFGSSTSRTSNIMSEDTSPVTNEATMERPQRRLPQAEIQRGATAPDLMNYAGVAPAEALGKVGMTQDTEPPRSAGLPQSPQYPTRRPVPGMQRDDLPQRQNSQLASPTSSSQATSPARPMFSAGTTTHAKGPVLQKTTRKFAGYDTVGKAGSSSGARRVMDWFRNRGKERSE